MYVQSCTNTIPASATAKLNVNFWQPREMIMRSCTNTIPASATVKLNVNFWQPREMIMQSCTNAHSRYSNGKT